ncbi:MFS transporter [Dyella nitratireducens]|uniref:MFS transporter n=1 Tax=Dyella nitratireducens TaxID=1849580 RepID=A0ABQ1FPH5_9GAMM|nr:MFS transporter [Dyella nitratireducens]GGA24330.1 MFS transporter [Dyella nitratireducens]GLQ43839.1 MFS transporter [Dyella nitratireducens]
MGSGDGQTLVAKAPAGYGEGARQRAGKILLDDVPLNFFHCKIAALTFGAHLTEGYAIGTIAYALTPFVDQIPGVQAEHRALWEGLIGSSTLLGIFLGSLLFGWLSDRVGRQKIFLLSFVIITAAAFAQFYVDTPLMLCLLRALLGLGMGGDFAVGHAMLAEFSPRKHRGMLLGSFSVIWTVGYVVANLIGMHFVQHSTDPDAWRWLLASSGVPALIVLILRMGTPESPRWLFNKGRQAEADAVVKKHFGPEVVLDISARDDDHVSGGFARLFQRDMIRRTAFNCIFFVCLVIPYFAIYTFLPSILQIIHLPDDSGADLLLNGLLVAGAVAGIWLTVKLQRRTFLISSFAITAASLALLSLLPASASLAMVASFALFTATLSAVSNLVGVYPPECFPTEVRASGVGFAIACSRLGSAVGVFLLPISMKVFGLQVSMMALAVVLVVGMAVSIFWAPETRHLRLNDCAKA